MKYSKLSIKYAAMLSVATLLTACSGGGGGGGSENQVNPPIIPIVNDSAEVQIEPSTNTPSTNIEAPGDQVITPIETPKAITITGAVQKGPFIIGTQVLVSRLDALGNASKSIAISEVENNIGSFTFTVDNSGPVQIVANGYYFSELTGQISNGTLTLKAIYDASSNNDQVAYVNILTHLISNRVLELIENGDVTIADAIAKSQTELVTALNAVVPIDNTPDFSALSVYNTNEENHVGNAYLLALSTAFYKYAEIKAEGQNTSTDAQLTLILNQIAKDFADDGVIQQAGFIQGLTDALRKLNPKAIAENLRNRSSIDFSEPLEIPDITVFMGLCAGTEECMWSARAAMPQPTSSHATAVWQDKIYVFGGVSTAFSSFNPYDVLNTSSADVYEYDSASNEWSQKQAMPVALNDLSAHTIGDKIYIFGGYGYPSFINAVMEFDPINNSWTQKAPMPTYRAFFASEAVKGKVYVIGGTGLIDNGATDLFYAWEDKSNVEIYDPETDSWSNGSSAPTSVNHGASCSIGDDIYILGGTVNGLESSDTSVYNVTTDSWNARSSAPSARRGHACVTIGNDLYLMGGDNFQGNQQKALDVLEIYSTENDTWSEVSYLPTARLKFAANSIGTDIFLLGGFGGKDDKLINSVEVLDTSKIEQ